MDLRTKKTLYLISENFLSLRKKKDLEKIRVSELCELSYINKSTFYRHYEDIYDLSNKLEDALLDNMLMDFKKVSLFHADYLEEVMTIARESYLDELSTLFNNRMDVLASKLFVRFHDIFLPQNASKQEEIINAFVIQGSLHAFLEANPDLRKITDEDLHTYASTLSSLLATLSKNKNVRGIIQDNILHFFKNNL